MRKIVERINDSTEIIGRAAAEVCDVFGRRDLADKADRLVELVDASVSSIVSVHLVWKALFRQWPARPSEVRYEQPDEDVASGLARGVNVTPGMTDEQAAEHVTLVYPYQPPEMIPRIVAAARAEAREVLRPELVQTANASQNAPRDTRAGEGRPLRGAAAAAAYLKRQRERTGAVEPE